MPTGADRITSLYGDEEKEILILTRDASSGAGRAGGDTWWTASNYILAYVDSATGALQAGDGRVVWPLSDADCKEKGSGYPYYFEGGCIYRLKVRELKDKTVPEDRLPSFYNNFLVVSVLEKNVRHDALEDILREYRKPVSITDDRLGTFDLDKNLGVLQGYIDWCGKTVSVMLDVDKTDKESWAATLAALRDLHAAQSQRDAEFRAFAARTLTDLANDWRDEDHAAEAVSEHSFAERISLSELTMGSDGEYTIYYDDDDMFGGHAIAVEGSLAEGMKDAYIAG